ncbi:RHS repeat protein [Rariglobus hedericola]|uniref:RHS repeat protein n=1 Tax=Rariglobus hedericola TaxID=2597822 RepID=A0A556QJH2_9BACT|nr:RHS repeat protein [Rariglobus hedericola]TSJ76772.1 RHS repeat protein [Rariglobus hedericola]
MKKLLAVILLCLVLLAVWGLWPQKQKSQAEKPHSVVTAAKEEAPVPVTNQGVPKQEIGKTKPDSSQASIPIPGQSLGTNSIVDADGVLLEEKVTGPDGHGEIKRRYSYGEDGRLMKVTDIDEAGLILLWEYTYDPNGKALIRMTDHEGYITTR